jgi:hypothetical protein
MNNMVPLQYVHDAEGKPVGVIVPIDLWHEIESERETAYLLNSEAMKARLLAAKDRTEGVSLEDARAKLGYEDQAIVTT